MIVDRSAPLSPTGEFVDLAKPGVCAASTSAAGALAIPAAPRYRSLDIWRGVACLMVVIGHSCFYMLAGDGTAPTANDAFTQFIAGLIPLTSLGVPIFFVISGYCIAATGDSTRRKPGAVGTYFKRRFRRIFPPFWIFLGLTALAVGLVSMMGYPGLFSDEIHPIHPPLSLNVAQWFGNLTLTESWRHLVFAEPQRYLVGHIWTLCYEEQFYAVCGLLLLCCPRRFFSGIAVVTVLTVVAKAISGRWNWPTAGFFFDGHWFQFAAGVLVYYHRNYAGRHFRHGAAALLALAAMGLFWRGGPLELPVALLCALVLCLGQRWDDALCGARMLRPLAWCGAMCYSLYLVHLPVVKAVSHWLWLAGVRGVWATLGLTVPVAAAVAIACAWVFHRLVERHFLNAPTRMNSPARPDVSALPVGARAEAA